MVIDVASKDSRIPPDLPAILKNFTKSAIRTQPRDLLSWSYAYFKALCDGESPPVKDHLEFPLPDTPSGITPGLLRVLHNKLSPLDTITISDLTDICSAFGVDLDAVQNSWDSAKEFGKEAKFWMDVLVELVKQISDDILQQLEALMQTISDDLFTKRVAVDEFMKYFDLVHCMEGDEDIHQEAIDYLTDVASYQNGFLTPADLNRPTCPLVTSQNNNKH